MTTEGVVTRAVVEPISERKPDPGAVTMASTPVGIPRTDGAGAEPSPSAPALPVADQ